MSTLLIDVKTAYGSAAFTGLELVTGDELVVLDLVFLYLNTLPTLFFFFLERRVIL